MIRSMFSLMLLLSAASLHPVYGEKAVKSSATPTKTVVATHKPSGIDTIYSALEAAYASNPELAAEITKINQADERMPQAKAGYRPTVQGELSIGATKSTTGGELKNKSLTSTAGQSSTPTAQAGVRVSQNIYAGGSTIASIKGAGQAIKASRARLLVLEQQIFLQVIQVVLDILQKESEIDLYQGNLKALSQTLDATKAKFDVGEETRTAVAQSEAQLSDGQAQLETSKAELEALRATFAKLTGRAPKKLQKPDHILKDLPNTLEKAIQFASENNPNIIATKFDAAFARYEVDRIGAGLLPSIDLRANSNFNASKDRTRLSVSNATFSGGNTRTDLSASVVMTVPIYEQGTVRSQKRAAHEAATGARISIETQRRVVIEKLIASWKNYQAAKANMESYKQQVKASQISLDGTQQEMQVGTKVILDVLNAQRDLLRSQLNLVRAERSSLFEAFSVLSFMGRLTAKQMKLKVNYYDPHIHYQKTRGQL